MVDFITMVTRITTELRRSNMTTEAKNAVNDAITLASEDRFYFNEMRGLVFSTVIGQEYYDDMGFVEIDAMYYTQGGARYNMYLDGNLQADERADGNVTSGQPQSFSRQGTDFRIYPVPTDIYAISVDGYGKLAPNPLVSDTDTNNWLADGEMYIRALAKSIMLKDVIKDYGEATVLETIAMDHKQTLLDKTNSRISTGRLQPTQF